MGLQQASDNLEMPEMDDERWGKATGLIASLVAHDKQELQDAKQKMDETEEQLMLHEELKSRQLMIDTNLKKIEKMAETTVERIRESIEKSKARIQVIQQKIKMPEPSEEVRKRNRYKFEFLRLNLENSSDALQRAKEQRVVRKKTKRKVPRPSTPRHESRAPTPMPPPTPMPSPMPPTPMPSPVPRPTPMLPPKPMSKTDLLKKRLVDYLRTERGQTEAQVHHFLKDIHKNPIKYIDETSEEIVKYAEHLSKNEAIVIDGGRRTRARNGFRH